MTRALSTLCWPLVPALLFTAGWPLRFDEPIWAAIIRTIAHGGM